MKLKYVIYPLLAISVVFFGVMGYLFFFAAPRDNATSRTESVLVSPTRGEKAIIADRARAASGKAGKLAIFYSGDLSGSLDPCG